MPERSSSKPPDATQELASLAEKWSSIDSDEKLKIMGEIYDTFAIRGGTKSIFLEMAVETLKLPFVEVLSVLDIIFARKQEIKVRKIRRKVEVLVVSVPDITARKLDILGKQWSSLNFPEMTEMLAEAYDSFIYSRGAEIDRDAAKKEFLDIAVGLLNRDMAVICLMLETYLIHGEKAFNPIA